MIVLNSYQTLLLYTNFSIAKYPMEFHDKPLEIRGLHIYHSSAS